MTTRVIRDAPRARVLGVLAAGFLSGAAGAQWTFIDLHPSGVQSSFLFGGSADAAVGTVVDWEGQPHAARWTGPGSPVVLLEPAGAATSSVYAASGDIQGGAVWWTPGLGGQAGYWRGKADSWTELAQEWMVDSNVAGVSSTQQVGAAFDGDYNSHAILWSGSAASMVDLSPDPNAGGASAIAVYGGRQGGAVGSLASLWSGTPESRVTLNPPGADFGAVYAMFGDDQFGGVQIAGRYRASKWTGTAESWVDLTPSDWEFAFVTAACDGFQAGRADISGSAHAVAWSGTRETAIDLHSFVPEGWEYSLVNGAWRAGGVIHVAGQVGIHGVGVHAALWTYAPPPPSPGDFNADGFIDLFDYGDFVACFEGEPCPEGRTADFNGDGFVDLGDYTEFVVAFESGA